MTPPTFPLLCGILSSNYMFEETFQCLNYSFLFIWNPSFLGSLNSHSLLHPRSWVYLSKYKCIYTYKQCSKQSWVHLCEFWDLPTSVVFRYLEEYGFYHWEVGKDNHSHVRSSWNLYSQYCPEYSYLSQSSCLGELVFQSLCPCYMLAISSCH